MKDFVVMGYEFDNEKAYLAAKQEMEDILQLKIDYDVKTYNGYLEFYNSILDNKLNKTPIGIEYVRNMQRELLKNTKDKSNIRNIIITDSLNENEIKEKVISRKKHEKFKNLEKNLTKYKDLYVKMIIVNVILVATIIVMFIMSEKSEKYDLDYYRESIENEYLDWENNLKERESSIADYEKASYENGVDNE
ncbi:MAG: hypothetical protein IJA34_17785 [Lachnospiraceae bacterium]|nr:hypothetical protein [Lachnospiraceae bacterium]